MKIRENIKGKKKEKEKKGKEKRKKGEKSLQGSKFG